MLSLYCGSFRYSIYHERLSRVEGARTGEVEGASNANFAGIDARAERLPPLPQSLRIDARKSSDFSVCSCTAVRFDTDMHHERPSRVEGARTGEVEGVSSANFAASMRERLQPLPQSQPVARHCAGCMSHRIISARGVTHRTWSKWSRASVCSSILQRHVAAHAPPSRAARTDEHRRVDAGAPFFFAPALLRASQGGGGTTATVNAVRLPRAPSPGPPPR